MKKLSLTLAIPVIFLLHSCASIYSGNSEAYITHVKKSDDSVLYKLNRSFVRSGLGSLLSDDPETIELYDKEIQKRRLRIVSPGVILGACIAVAVVSPPGSALMIISSLAIPVLPVTPFLIKRTPFTEFIKTYNLNNIPTRN